MDRFYIVPIITVIDPEIGTVRKAKYLSDYNFQRTCLDYGAEDVMLCYVKGIDQATHDLIVANSDVLAAPENIDQNPTAGAVTVIATFLESMLIPGDWVTVLFTFREIIRVIGGIFQFNQRYGGIDKTKDNIIAKAANNLELQYQDLPADVKTKLLTVAESFDPPLSSANITATSTVRFILYDIGKQFLTRQLLLAGDVI